MAKSAEIIASLNETTIKCVIFRKKEFLNFILGSEIRVMMGCFDN